MKGIIIKVITFITLERQLFEVILINIDELFSIGNFSLSTDENMSPTGRADRLTIQEILNAAGVASLDELSDALNAKGKPFRRHGIVLHVAIHYQNADSTFFGTGYVR